MNFNILLQYIEESSKIEITQILNYPNFWFAIIGFKLKQALYFLEKTSKEDEAGLWAEKREHFEFTLKELLEWMEVKNVNDLENILKRVPPSIFNIDFVFSENIEKNKPSIFEDLSSGEQQKIHTVNTIIYHLNNLYSVHLAKSEKKRIEYQFVNVILDEIELYYHPDLQRRFVNDLIDTLRTHKHLVEGKYLKALNFIFSTHSPFILSDIPEQNILKLEHKPSSFNSDKKSNYSLPTYEKRQTFGANIHDLLSNSFFLENGFMGEFSRLKLTGLISYLTDSEEDSKNQEHWSIEKAESLIEIIGEPYLKDDLNELLHVKRKRDFNSIDLIENEIRRLELLKNKLTQTK